MHKTIKGYLVANGGAEDKGNQQPQEREIKDVVFHSEGVLKNIVDLLS